MSPLLILAAGLFQDTSFLTGEAVLAMFADFSEDVVDRILGVVGILATAAGFSRSGTC